MTSFIVIQEKIERRNNCLVSTKKILRKVANKGEYVYETVEKDR
jgi:hypothetical protein